MYYNWALSQKDFLKEYSKYSYIERLTCILTLELNDVMDSYNFGCSVHAILVEHDKNKLHYYWFDNTVKSYDVTLIDDISDELEKLMRIISLRFDVLKAEGVFDEQWSQVGNACHIVDTDEKKIYMLTVADWKGYSSSKLWKHVIDVFAENWEWILEADDDKEIVNLSPSDACRNADYYWGIRSVPCCRIMAESGFETGYGDPYESSVFYDVISGMASTYYEKRTSKGTIVHINEDVEPDVSFINPIMASPDNCRILRKYLEMAQNGFALAVKGDSFVGLVSPARSAGKVEFLGVNQWRFLESEEVVFSVNNYKINVSTSLHDDKDIVINDKWLDTTSKDIIKEIAKKAIHQEHGTTLMFSDEAEYEAKRLSEYNRCQLILPINLIKNPQLILPLSSIDGALIIGFDGNCYGVGAILDGEAVKAGSIGRGARYNSALNYVAWRKIKSISGKYCAVIISEDGVINVITSENVDRISDDNETDPDDDA